MKKIVIAGAGISGLTLAFRLLQKGLDVTVIEADNRAGGKIWSDRVDGFLCERGPNGFLDNKPKTLALCGDLGVEPVRSNENSKKRYIFSGNKLNALPESPPAFIKSDLLSWGGKLRLLLELNAPKGPPDETVADFILRRLGREALEKLIDPMCSGIYAGDPYRMSISSCFPRIKELEQEYGSLIKALFKIRREKKREAKSHEAAKVSAAPGGTLTSFFGGAQTLTDALAEKVGGALKTGAAVQGITRENPGYQIFTSSETIRADIVVLATPAYVSANILEDFDADIANMLSAIPYPHVSVVCLGYRKENVAHNLNGFGFLVPHREERKILGTLWDSSVFPNRASEGHALLRTMVGGAQYPEMAMLEDNKIIDTVFSELNEILGLKTEPDMVRIYRWEKAIPQYLLGHGKLLDGIDDRMRQYTGLYLTGNSYRGIGINDCVENSERLAREISDSLT